MNLFWEAVPEPVTELLQQIMRMDELAPFALAGGTALALRFGHRRSVDLDLFSVGKFPTAKLAEQLGREIKLENVEIAENSISGFAVGIKVDLIAHRYDQIAPIETAAGTRLYSLADNAAMKLNAISNRGSKKDFWDLRELLEHFTKEQLLNFFAQKYPTGSLWAVEKSLVYFEDAEGDPNPIDLRNRDWAEIKQAILAAARMS